MKLTFTLLFLALINTLSAQIKLSGKLTNPSHSPLPYGVVSLLNTHNNKTQNAQTDSTGSFSFKIPRKGNYIISASYIGYQKKETAISITRDTSFALVMQTAANQLGEVTITANKPVFVNNAEKLVYDLSASITATGTDALTAIGQIPGVKVNGGEIGIAGKGMVKVMVNDRLIQLSGTDLMRYLKSIAANQVSKIELIKNPPASLEADGNAGLINIITKQSKQKGYSGNIQFGSKRFFYSPSTAYGESNYYALNGNASLNYNSGKWSAYGSINTDKDYHLEGFGTAITYPKQTWLQTDTGDYKYRNINFIFGVDRKISDKATVGISYLGGRNLYIGADHVNNPIYGASGKLDSTLKTYADYYPIANNHSINAHTIIKFDTSGTKLVLNADYYIYHRTDRSNFESNSYAPNGTVIPTSRTRYYDTTKQNFNIYTFKADADVPTSFAKFSFGGKLSFINNYSNLFFYDRKGVNDLTFNPSLSNEFDYTENTQSLYASMNKEQDKWKYQIGLRAELTQTKGYSYTLQNTTNNNYIKLFPSVLVSYQPNTDNSLSFAYGRRINRPTFWNLNPYKSFYTAYSYLEGNPYLQPEYNTNLELSHTLKSNLTSALFLNITNNGFNNAIITSESTNIVRTIPLNFIKTYKYGISESVSLKSFDWLENNNQFTFYHTDAYSEIKNFNDIHGFGAYIATNNTLYFNKAKTFAAAVNFWYQFPEVDHIGRSSAYSKVDIGFTALAFKKDLNISLLLNDVFLNSAPAITTMANGITQKFTNFQLNRFLQLSLSYRFGSKQTNVSHETGNADERKR